MPPLEENFSKIVRSLLLDVDVHLDQLEQIGYLSKEQRAFLDKFLYKSEDALRAAYLTSGSELSFGSEILSIKMPYSDSSIPRVQIPSPSKATDSSSIATPYVLPQLRSVTEQLKSEENALSTFLKRCNARNFSVQVKCTDIGKEISSKVKGSDYVSTLEPIAEGAAKESINNSEVNYDTGNSTENVNHDRDMMLYGAGALTIDFDTESVEYENSVQRDITGKLNPDEIGRKITEDIPVEPENPGIHPTKTGGFIAATVKSDCIQTAVKPTQIDLVKIEPTNLGHRESATSNAGLIRMKSGNSDVQNEQEQVQDNSQLGDDSVPQRSVADTESEPETNAWGKPLKPDPTRNKEGTIVGASAKPLGIENKGRAMMERMGWSTGTGLGKQNGGILEPVTHVVKNTKTGLRSSDEKKNKSRQNLLPEEKIPTSLPDHATEENVTDSNDLSWKAIPYDPNWDKPVALMIKKGEGDANPAALEKNVRDLEKNQSANLNVRSPFTGIKAIYLREGNSPGLEKTISFNTRIQSTNENKTTMHSPGIIVRALSAQGSKSVSDTSFHVGNGSVLEVLRVHRGDEYHVYNFRSRKRGIVRISLLEMVEEPKEVLAVAVPLTVISNPVAARV